MGIVVEKVLTNDYRFNAEYTKAIEDKKVRRPAGREEQVGPTCRHGGVQTQAWKRPGAKSTRWWPTPTVSTSRPKSRPMSTMEQQQLLAKAIEAEGIAEAKGIQEMNNALAGSGGEAIVKLRIAEALQGKRIMLTSGIRGRHEPQDHRRQPVDRNNGRQIAFRRTISRESL